MLSSLFHGARKQVNGMALRAYASQLALRLLTTLFPALLVLVTLLAIWIKPQAVIDGVTDALSDIVPGAILDLIHTNISTLLSGGSLAVFSIGFALLIFTVSSLLRDLMTILNTVYGVEEHRSIVKRVAVSFVFLALGIVIAVAIVQLLFLTGDIVRFLNQLFDTELLSFNFLFWRWPFVLVTVFLFVYLSYVFIPNQPRHYWKYKLPGALLFAVVWLLTSLVFNWYVSNFADYNKTYGVLGTVILLLFYLQINTQLYLLGGVINAQLIAQHGDGAVWERVKTFWS